MSTTTRYIARYTAIAKALGCLNRCEASNNEEWTVKHKAALEELCGELPSGSGFDAGSELDLAVSTPEKLVFNTSFHHMDDNGCYCRWTEHQVILTPSFEHGYSMRVTGPNKNDIKDYIRETFGFVLDADVDQWTGYEKPAALAAAGE